MIPAPVRPASLLDFGAAVRPWHWLGVAAAILLVDYLTGPYIQFPILFILPVVLATASHGVAVGVTTAALLPLVRLLLFAAWGLTIGWLDAVDAAVDVGILLGFALLVDRLFRQQREIQVLKGLLPICSFCKRIREDDGEWRQFETYITQRSDARFSHTFCPDCGRQHYPGMVE